MRDFFAEEIEGKTATLTLPEKPPQKDFYLEEVETDYYSKEIQPSIKPTVKKPKQPSWVAEGLKKTGKDILEGFKDIPTQLQDLLTIPSRIVKTPRPPSVSKLATETIPQTTEFLKQKAFTPLATVKIPPLSARNIKSVFTGKGITETAEIEPSAFDVAWYSALIGYPAFQNIVSRQQWNTTLNKLIQTERFKGTIMENMPAIEQYMTTAGIRLPKDLSLKNKVNVVISQAQRSPTLTDVLIGLEKGKIKPKTPIVSPIETTAEPTPSAVTPKVAIPPVTPPVKPEITAPILALKLKSGTIIQDTTAKFHTDIISNKNISPDSVVNVGYLDNEGKYIATKLPDEKGGMPLETLPEVPKEALEKAKGITKAKILKSAVKLLPEDIEKVRSIAQQIYEGIAGKRMPVGEERKWIGIASTFPAYFRDKGYTKKETLAIIDKVKNGIPITEKQQAIFNDLLFGYKAQLESEVKFYEQSKQEDEFRNELKKQGYSEPDIEEIIRLAQKDAQDEITTEGIRVISGSKFFKIPAEADIYITDIESKGGQAQVVRVSPEEVEVSYSLPETLTPGGEIRAELQPPIKKDLFQEKGELFALPRAPSGNAMAGVWQNQIPVEMGQTVFQLKPAEFPELVSLAKDLTGAPPTLKKFPKVAGKFYGVGKGQIKLTPELFKRGNEQQLAIVLAHELGHLTDYLPEHTLKRGNLLGRLLTLQQFMKNTFGGFDVTNKEIKQELLNVTQHLHPYDETVVPKGYLAYRRSAKELYAEAISLLLNSPGTIERLAPKFIKTFFDYLDKKPEVKEAYFGLQQLLSGKREDVLAKRQRDIRQMFVKGKDLRDQLEKEKRLAKVNTWERIRQLVDDINRPILKKVQDNEAEGDISEAGKQVEYLLQENSLIDSENYLLVADIDNQIIHPLQKAGIELTDFEEYLFLRRVVGRPDIKLEPINFEDFDVNELAKITKLVERAMDRKDIANPLGLAPQSAQEQLDFLKSQIGEEKFNLLEQSAQKFHDIVYKSVEEAVNVGSYNRETFDKIIEPNRDVYVTFGVLNYLQNFVPATVKMQKGTLQEIESPFIITILKTISLNRLNAKQRALNAWRDYWLDNFPDEIKKSKVIRFAEGVSKTIEPPRGSGLASVKMLEDGKLVSYDVDEYIAKSFDSSKIGDLQLGMMLNKLLGNQIFKNLYITYNPGFAFAFNPVRDFKRTYVNLNALGYKVTLRQLLVEYAKNLPDTIKRQQGVTEGIIREMMENKALDIPFIDFNYDIKNDTYQHILERLHLLEGEVPHWQKLAKPILKPLVKILEAIRFGGSVIESLSKVAGYSILKGKKLSDGERAYFTRNYIGTPNFRTKGEITSTTNALYIFSNIFKEGLKRDLSLAVRPKTRGGWWWANTKVNLMPKFLMWLAASGALGIGLKKIYDRMSEYDKTNYIAIPLGVRKDGRVVQLRIPHDETGRLTSAIFWKVLNGLKDKDLKQVQQIFAFGAGQLPGLAPAITMGMNWAQYLTGKNPYDNFRGRYIISETDWNAGGWPTLKKMGQWTINEAGLSQFTTYDDKRNESFDTLLQLTPIVNRLLKVTDYGLTEKLQRIKQEFKEERAETILLKREVFNKYVGEYKQGKDPNLLLSKIQQEVYGGQPIDSQKISGLKESFVKAILRDYNNPFINAFISAPSNKEKLAILAEMKETISIEEYNRIVNTLKRFGY